jgi:hypothetical protein
VDLTDAPVIEGGMRLSAPDDNPVTVDCFSPTDGSATMGTSPVQHISTSFPAVHRALYAVQGDRLNQSNEVDISNLLQLPQYYWNNWDQWMSNAIHVAEGPNGADAFPLNDAHLPTDTLWNVPLNTSVGAGCEDPSGQHHQTPTSAEAQGQAAVTTALLRYMLEGAQAKS